jgi:hypothetical protein
VAAVEALPHCIIIIIIIVIIIATAAGSPGPECKDECG